jgi:hypothetical protein
MSLKKWLPVVAYECLLNRGNSKLSSPKTERQRFRSIFLTLADVYSNLCQWLAHCEYYKEKRVNVDKIELTLLTALTDLGASETSFRPCDCWGATGFFEAVVFVYLRQFFYPEGFAFPLRPMSPGLLAIESLGRFQQ